MKITNDSFWEEMTRKVLLGCTENDVQVICAFLGVMRSLYIPHTKEEN